MDKNQYIFGLRAVIEAIEAGKEIDKVLLRKDMGGELARELIALIRTRDIPCQRVPVEKLNRITMKNHQGAIALLSPVTYWHLDELVPRLFEEGTVPFIIVLDGVTDTRNFGAIARTAECAGADAIVIPRRDSVSVTPDAVKTSAGALLHLPVCREHSTASAIRYLKECGIRVLGATEKGTEDYTRVDMTVPLAIVMGAEDTGLSEESLRLCDKLAGIPMIGRIASLNVSVAAGIFIYEAVRQRLQSGMDAPAR